MLYGHWGRILRVNLSKGKIAVEDDLDATFLRRYVGGGGLIAYYLLKELRPGLDPLGPDNKLIFATGPLTGAPFSGSGRNSVGAKSPLTGAFGKSEVGGYWGAELKRAGYDGLIVEGRAQRPAYLWIHEDGAEIRDAAHLWGQPTLASQEAIRAEVRDKLARVAQIGPAGERMVRFACIVNDLRSAAGRTGMGAVMGSKNLKAVAVRGRKNLALANPEQVKTMAKAMAAAVPQVARAFHDLGTGAAMVAYNASGNLPTANFREGFFPQANLISAEALRNSYRIKMESCYACAVRCKKVVQVDDPDCRVDPNYGGPEYETLAAFGSNCGISDLKAVCRAHHLCHAASLDTISAGATIAFAMECYERGLLTKADTDGIELTFGNAQAMLQVLEKIIRREGIGDLLAEGSRRAAQRIGRGAEELALDVKGVEMGMHEPRLKAGLGVGFAVANHGGDHGTGLHDTLYEKEGPLLREARQLGFLEPLPAHDLSPRKVALFAYLHQWRNFHDSLVVCYFVPWNFGQLTQLVEAVTGWNTSIFEGMKVGERAITLSRAFNLREGLTVGEDRLPGRFFGPTRQGPLSKQALDPAALERAKQNYYRLMGWDPQSGVPSAVKLGELGLEWVGDELEAAGIRVA